ncbi:MAG: type IV pilus biogenesis/stability protein PilW [Burkholderiaceae bacterium]
MPLWSWAGLSLLSLLLAACAAPPAANNPANGPRTDSDQTDADRRAGVRMELAAGYFARGQYKTALDEIKQALLVKPEMREAINLRGLVYAAMGEQQLADENFRRALTLYPGDADTLHNYGWLLCQQQKWGAADEKFDQALAQSSYRAPARTWMIKGVCQARSNRMADAERSLARAFELDPGSPAVAVNLSEVLYRNQQLERALFYVRRVNGQQEQSNAQSLWLELRIEKRLGDGVRVSELGQQLRRRYPQSPELQALDAGRFDE